MGVYFLPINLNMNRLDKRRQVIDGNFTRGQSIFVPIVQETRAVQQIRVVEEHKGRRKMVPNPFLQTKRLAHGLRNKP